MDLSLEDQFRIDYCLGKSIIGLNKHPEGKDHLSQRVFVSKAYDTILKVTRTTTFRNMRPIHKQYIEEIVRLLQELEIDAVVPVLCQDNRKPPFTPTIVKSRTINTPNSTLLKLYQSRHWADVESIYMEDIDFSKKRDMCLWRGASTGYWGRASMTHVSSQRYHLFLNWAGDISGTLDLGMTQEVQWLYNKLSNGEAGIMRKYFEKKKMSKQEMLDYKFIISLEGNDVSSSLNWI